MLGSSHTTRFRDAGLLTAQTKMYGVGDDEKSIYHQARKEAYKLMSRDSFHRFVREDVQNRILLPVVGVKWCEALHEALQQHLRGDHEQPTPAHKTLIGMLADDVKPMARYALLGESSHDYLAFLTSGAESAPYDSDAKFQMSLEAL